MRLMIKARQSTSKNHQGHQFSRRICHFFVGFRTISAFSIEAHGNSLTVLLHRFTRDTVGESERRRSSAQLGRGLDRRRSPSWDEWEENMGISWLIYG